MTDTKKIIEVEQFWVNATPPRRYDAFIEGTQDGQPVSLMARCTTFTEALAWLKSKIGEEL